jgi:hypothetical protein
MSQLNEHYEIKKDFCPLCKETRLIRFRYVFDFLRNKNCTVCGRELLRKVPLPTPSGQNAMSSPIIYDASTIKDPKKIRV